MVDLVIANEAELWTMEQWKEIARFGKKALFVSTFIDEVAFANLFPKGKLIFPHE